MFRFLHHSCSLFYELRQNAVTQATIKEPGDPISVFCRRVVVVKFSHTTQCNLNETEQSLKEICRILSKS